jgi:SAM-dependent methyltransferase
MSLKEKLRPLLLAVSRYPAFWVAVHSRPGRLVFERLLDFGGLYAFGLNRPHPYDLRNGTDTGGVALSGGKQTDHPYWGAAPTVVRKALAKLLALEKFTFIDLGCGKGRPLFVASEFPFQAIIGVELSETLAAVGQANAAAIAQRYPERTRVEVIPGDAANFRLPPGNIVLYLYNPFGEELMQKVAAEVEAALASGPRTIYVIYQNPVVGQCFDASPALKRYYAGHISYAWEERGFRLDVRDTRDAVVIWHGGLDRPEPLPGAEAKIEITRMLHANRARLVK